MHALYALDGSGALTETHLLNALDDRDALVREHAVRLAEQFSRQSGQRQSAAFQPLERVASSGPASPWRKLRGKLCALANDPSPRVRYQLAFTLGESKDPDEIKALAGIIRRDASDRWTRAAVLNSLKDGAGEIFEQLAADSHCLDSAGGQEFL